MIGSGYITERSEDATEKVVLTGRRRTDDSVIGMNSFSTAPAHVPLAYVSMRRPGRGTSIKAVRFGLRDTEQDDPGMSFHGPWN